MFSPGSNFYGKFKVLKTKISDITRVKFVTKNLSEQFYLVYAGQYCAFKTKLVYYKHVINY